jgi:hypothetical protein
VVVAAGAVVRGEVPDHAVVAGAPARIVRRWEGERGWQPPLRTPAPGPSGEGSAYGSAPGSVRGSAQGAVPEQLLGVSELAAGEGE